MDDKYTCRGGRLHSFQGDILANAILSDWDLMPREKTTEKMVEARNCIETASAEQLLEVLVRQIAKAPLSSKRRHRLVRIAAILMDEL